MRKLRFDPEMRCAACATSFTGVSTRPAMIQPRMEPKIRPPGITPMKTARVYWLRRWMSSDCGLPIATKNGSPWPAGDANGKVTALRIRNGALDESLRTVHVGVLGVFGLKSASAFRTRD